MARVLVCYYSRSGHTEHMAASVAKGAGEVQGANVELKSVADVSAGRLLDYDAIVMGSPVYYGMMAAEMKKLLDESVSIHGKLKGKVGGAFASSANIGGGNETTTLGILQAMLIHGMVIQGLPEGDHYGPVAIGDEDDRSRRQCLGLGRSVAELAVKLHG
ncbi:MAG: NAD(P)H-dependent oxidoreductase [Planctomycetes bacterium]|nr:NAD(P)H-dependent oxidoreductase [Planctomycetota bacterium]